MALDSRLPQSELRRQRGELTMSKDQQRALAFLERLTGKAINPYLLRSAMSVQDKPGRMNATTRLKKTPKSERMLRLEQRRNEQTSRRTGYKPENKVTATLPRRLQSRLNQRKSEQHRTFEPPRSRLYHPREETDLVFNPGREGSSARNTDRYATPDERLWRLERNEQHRKRGEAPLEHAYFHVDSQRAMR